MEEEVGQDRCRRDQAVNPASPRPAALRRAVQIPIACLNQSSKGLTAVGRCNASIKAL